MVEELVADDEEQVPSGHPAIVGVAAAGAGPGRRPPALAELEYLSPERTTSELAGRMTPMATGSLAPSARAARDSAAV